MGREVLKEIISKILSILGSGLFCLAYHCFCRICNVLSSLVFICRNSLLMAVLIVTGLAKINPSSTRTEIHVIDEY